MTTISTAAVQAIEHAEAAWIEALVEGEEALIALMLPDSTVVHGPAGKVDDRETWARFHLQRRRSVSGRATRLSITVRGSIAIATCFQEMYTVLDESGTPFPMQETVTRVWAQTPAGWRVAHMHMARRFPPV
ncbi:YybH family protein [Actinoplanes subtropicus]|uniref:YybH family protein n=1 Tax=Actinoplanes subtropicus TaxID=543632 RepID=UPI0004C42501|nr:nuclear transport factor 2 family protein [Actinoplanes subtropicus]